jgi:hypothetical protein
MTKDVDHNKIHDRRDKRSIQQREDFFFTSKLDFNLMKKIVKCYI